MSRFRKLTHAIWYCQYHLIWVPKYRYRVLEGEIGESVGKGIRAFSGQKGCEVTELNVQRDHVHLLVFIPPKVSVSTVVGTVKGRTALAVFRQFPHLRRKPYWGNHFWSPGYCVDTVGVNAEMIRQYVRYQERRERRLEQMRLKFK